MRRQRVAASRGRAELRRPGLSHRGEPVQTRGLERRHAREADHAQNAVGEPARAGQRVGPTAGGAHHDEPVHTRRVREERDVRRDRPTLRPGSGVDLP